MAVPRWVPLLARVAVVAARGGALSCAAPEAQRASAAAYTRVATPDRLTQVHDDYIDGGLRALYPGSPQRVAHGTVGARWSRGRQLGIEKVWNARGHGIRDEAIDRKGHHGYCE